MSTQEKKGFFKTLSAIAKKEQRTAKSDHKANMNDMAIGIFAVILGVAGAVAGAIAFPMLYALNFGNGITLAVTGFFAGGATGFFTPITLSKISLAVPWGLLKPKNYKKAWQESRPAKTAPAPSVASAPKAAMPEPKKVAASAKAALNSAAPTAPKAAKNKNAASPAQPQKTPKR